MLVPLAAVLPVENLQMQRNMDDFDPKLQIRSILKVVLSSLLRFKHLTQVHSQKTLGCILARVSL